jgi:hypothetical protein
MQAISSLCVNLEIKTKSKIEATNSKQRKEAKKSS